MNGKQLKNSILQLAIQGKLVPQDPNDESASALLQRIHKEKEQLVKDGILKKKDLVTVPINDDEKPYEIPDNWEWCRLKDIVYNNGQKTPDKVFSYIDIGSIDNKNQKLNDQENLIEAKNAPSRARKIVKHGDIVYSTVRPYLHNVAIIDRQFSAEPIASTGFAVLSSIIIYNKYLLYFLLSPQFDEYANDGDNAKGIAYPAINDDKLYKACIPLPPLSEQIRIVAKIEQMLPFVEEYDKAQMKLDELNTKLPDALKKSFLQEAIQGKLVAQNPEDEPSSKLLELISLKKEQLVKEGKFKKKDLISTPVKEDERLFDIPESWEWVRLNNIALVARGGSPRPIKDYITESPNGVNWIKIGDTEKGGKYINSCAEKIKPEGVQRSRMVHPGDFLLTNSMSFGRPYITNVEGCIHDGWLVISQYYEGYDPDFLYYMLSSPFAFSQFSDKTAGAVVQNLNKDKVAESVFPLPPIEEQKRIVNKIEELFKIIQ